MKFDRIVAVNNRAGEGVVHTHNTWEIILACSGEGDVIIDENKYHFKRGTVVCVPPRSVHYNVSDGDYSHIAIIVKRFINPTDVEVPVFFDDEERTFETLAGIALRVFYKYERGRELMLDSLYDSLYGFFFGRVVSKNSNTTVEIAKNMMISRFSDPEFKISDTYAGTYYSAGHFRRMFRAEMGMTPVEYLTKLRLEYAATMLEDSNACCDKISHIALCSGFYDARYFSRVFKKYFGIAPQKYRKSIIGKENEKNT